MPAPPRTHRDPAEGTIEVTDPFRETADQRKQRLADQLEAMSSWRIPGSCTTVSSAEHEMVLMTLAERWDYFGPIVDLAARHLAKASYNANLACVNAMREGIDDTAWTVAGGALLLRHSQRLERLSWVAAVLAGHIVGDNHQLPEADHITVAEFGEVLAQLIEGAP